MRKTTIRLLAALAAGLAAGIAPAAATDAERGASKLEGPAFVTSFSGAFLAARAAEADNDLPNAIRYYKQALIHDPDNVTLLQSVMLALLSQGEFSQALPYAEKLKSVPEAERFSRVALAIDAFEKKQWSDAEFYLTLAMQSDLDKLITGLMAGWAKAGSGDGAGAIAHLDALEGPDWYGLFRNVHKALVADFTGMNDQAAELYELTAVTRSAADVAPEAYVRLIEAYAGFQARQGRKDEALKTLERVEEFSTARPTTLALRKLIEAGGKPEPFIASPAQGAAEVLFGVASALNRGGGESFVRLYLQMAHRLAPGNDAVLMQLGGVSEAQDKLEEAIAFYQQVEAASPLKRIAEMQMGLGLAELERDDEAVKHLSALLDQEPDDMRAYLALGGVYSGAEKYAEAAKVYDRAVDRLKQPTKSDWNIFYQRGIAYERIKQWPKAEPNFRKALELSPNQAQVLNYLGYSWIDMNMNLEEGLDLIKKAVELRPSDGFIIDSLGWGYYRLGRYEEAVTELERAVSLQPADPILNDHLGDAYWKVGRRLEARFQWNHARDLKPEPDVLAKVLEKIAHGMPEETKALAALDKPAVQPGTATDAVDGPDDPSVAPTPREQAPVQQQAATPEPQRPADAGARTPHTVSPGQSLWSISVERLGSGERYREILRLNPEIGRNPNRIFPGQQLKLP